MKKHLLISGVLFLFSLGIAFGFTYNYKTNNKIVKNNTNQIVKEDTQVEEVKEEKVEDERIPYVLIAGLPQSSKIKSTLIALYDTKNHSINYFPFNYDIKKGDKDTGLGYLSPEDIMTEFQDIGLNIIDVIPLDNEDVQKLYVEYMNQNGKVYTITFKSKDGKEKKFPIKSWQNLSLILTKNYTSNFYNLENLQHQFLLLLKNQDFFNEYMTGTISNENLYDKEHLYSITGKQFPTEYVNNKTLQVDKDYIYLKGLIDGDINEYLTELENSKKVKADEQPPLPEEKTTKKKSLKERLAELKSKSKKKESLKDRLKRLKAEKKQKENN